jgi:DNA-binding transcriptional LysR family regulator
MESSRAIFLSRQRSVLVLVFFAATHIDMNTIPNRHSPDFRLAHLRIFKLLLQERSLTRAARVMGTTQPVLSKALSKLRRQLGDPLFVRIGARMEPTVKALSLARPIDRILAAAGAFEPDLPEFDLRTSDRTFRILISDSGVIRLLPLLMARVASEAPFLRLIAVPIEAQTVARKLESGDVDLAVGSFPDLVRGIRRRRLYAEGYLSLLRKDHPELARMGSRKIFVAQRHVLVGGSSAGHAGHHVAETLLQAAIAPSNISLMVPSFVSAALVAKHTNAIATMPARLAVLLASELDLKTVDPPIAMPRIEIAQYWHERSDRDACNRWVRSLFVDVSRR